MTLTASMILGLLKARRVSTGRSDYYADEKVDAGAEDIKNAYRVLIIMLAEDY